MSRFARTAPAVTRESVSRLAIAENGWGSWVDLTAIYPNRGFTGGNNAVIRPALDSDDPPEYILLLNADTTVEEHALDALVEFMDRHPRTGIAGSRLLSPEGEIQCSPFRMPGIATELDRGLQLGIVTRFLSPPMPSPEQAERTGWVAGASMILRRSMLDQIGLLDEGLFTYFDDVDICLRAARAGLGNLVRPRKSRRPPRRQIDRINRSRITQTPSHVLAPGQAPIS